MKATLMCYNYFAVTAAAAEEMPEINKEIECATHI